MVNAKAVRRNDTGNLQIDNLAIDLHRAPPLDDETAVRTHARDHGRHAHPFQLSLADRRAAGSVARRRSIRPAACHGAAGVRQFIGVPIGICATLRGHVTRILRDIDCHGDDIANLRRALLRGPSMR